MSRASELTSRDAVVRAIAEYDLIGRDAFLEKYAFGRSRSFVVVHGGREYDSKALIGAGYTYQYPDSEPLAPGDFSGGDETRRVLEKLGFAMTMVDGEDADLFESNLSA